MNLFEYCCQNYSVYPEILGYYYQDGINVNKIKKYDFVFISSDYADKIPGCTAIHMMTSADQRNAAVMWLQQDFSSFHQMPASEYTEVPVVGFVGRIPMFTDSASGVTKLHRGFEDRLKASEILGKSNEICADFHIHSTPDGDSKGFWNETRPDYKKNGPLFKSNMMACQYQLCTRGNANWSLRFYESLAYGRIPVYVGSDGKFPLNQDFSPADIPFVYCESVGKIEDKILEFHFELGEKSIGVIQRDCRRFYDDHFSQDAQIRKFDEMFKCQKN
jgi:hypothetical protein